MSSSHEAVTAKMAYWSHGAMSLGVEHLLAVFCLLSGSVCGVSIPSGCTLSNGEFECDFRLVACPLPPPPPQKKKKKKKSSKSNKMKLANCASLKITHKFSKEHYPKKKFRTLSYLPKLYLREFKHPPKLPRENPIQKRRNENC